MQDPTGASGEPGIVEDIQATDLGRWTPRRLGWPALLDWWPAYIAIGGAAILVVLATARTLFQIAQPVAHVFIVFTFAAALTFALLPLADRLEVTLRSRVAAVLAIGAFLLGTVAILGFAIVAGVAAESERLATAIREYGEAVQGRRPLMIGDRQLSPDVRDRIREFMEANGPALAELSRSIVVAVAATIVDAALILVISIYLLLDVRRMRAIVLRALSPQKRAPLRRVTHEVARVFGAYLRAQIVLALSVGLLVTLLLAAFGVPYAVLIGVFAGLVELVPMVGPVLGAVPALAAAATQPFPTVVWVAIGFLIIQQLEANILMPKLLGGAIGLHPVAAILALLGGFGIGGPVGALIAVPIVGLAWVFVSTAALAWRGKRIEVAQRQHRPWRPRRGTTRGRAPARVTHLGR